MKKTFLILFVLACAVAPSFSESGNGDPVPLTVKPVNPDIENNPPAKGPIHIPTVYLEDNVLTFDESLEGCTVRLLDEGETVVFSDFIEENQTSLAFPSNLSGTYELQIIRGSITFYCEIEL